MPINKQIIKFFLLFGLQILSITKMLSQDSIFFRSSVPVSAKVIEVNNTEIKYYRNENSSGPLYISSKNNIAYIKYADNYIDSFSVITVTAHKPYPKLEIKHGNVYCKNKKINNAQLLELLEDIEDTTSQNKLIDEFNLMKRYQKKHFTNNLGATIVFGGSAFYGLLFFALNVPELAIIMVAGGAVIFVPAMIFSIKNKKKHLMQQKILVDDYNHLK